MYTIVVLCFAVVRRTYVPHCHSNIDHRQRSSNAASIIAIGTVTIDHRQRSGNASSIIACGAVTIEHRQRSGITASIIASGAVTINARLHARSIEYETEDTDDDFINDVPSDSASASSTEARGAIASMRNRHAYQQQQTACPMCADMRIVLRHLLGLPK